VLVALALFCFNVSLMNEFFEDIASVSGIIRIFAIAI
jgi:hypothetical protein